MSNTLAGRMASYAQALSYADLSPAAIHEVKRRIIDSLGCAMGAWNSEPGQIARNTCAGFSALPGSTLIGTDRRVPPDWAAFANGCLVRYLDYNDTYLSKEPAHPSDNIPPALAAAEASGAGGSDLIVAIVIAYEVQCRLCDAASLRAIGWDHVTYGTFSSALAAGRLMKLDAARLRHALGIAGVASAALRQTRVGELSHWKGCAFANAARHGVFAALLAQQGMTGPAPIFEGEKGFEKLVSGMLELAGPFARAGVAGTPEMILRTSIKCWPVEYHAQSAVQAALQLRGQIDDVAQIESVTIESHDAAVDIIGSELEKWRPQSRETADHSLPYITAAALMDGRIDQETFAPSRYGDVGLLEFVSRVKVVRNSELSGLYPGAVGNIVHVNLRGGKTMTQRVDHARGHAANPMTDAQVEAKFHSMADPLLGNQRAGQVVGACWNLENLGSISELMKLLICPASRRTSAASPRL